MKKKLILTSYMGVLFFANLCLPINSNFIIYNSKDKNVLEGTNSLLHDQNINDFDIVNGKEISINKSYKGANNGGGDGGSWSSKEWYKTQQIIAEPLNIINENYFSLSKIQYKFTNTINDYSISQFGHDCENNHGNNGNNFDRNININELSFDFKNIYDDVYKYENYDKIWSKHPGGSLLIEGYIKDKFLKIKLNQIFENNELKFNFEIQDYLWYKHNGVASVKFKSDLSHYLRMYNPHKEYLKFLEIISNEYKMKFDYNHFISTRNEKINIIKNYYNDIIKKAFAQRQYETYNIFEPNNYKFDVDINNYGEVIFYFTYLNWNNVENTVSYVTNINIYFNNDVISINNEFIDIVKYGFSRFNPDFIINNYYKEYNQHYSLFLDQLFNEYFVYKKIDNNVSFSTILEKEMTIDKILNNNNKIDNNKINFQTLRKDNNIENIALGELVINLFFGQNFSNLFSDIIVSNSNNNLKIKMYNFRKQYDVYKLDDVNDLSFMEFSGNSMDLHPKPGYESYVSKTNSLTLPNVENINIDEYQNNEFVFDGYWVLNNLITYINEDFYTPITIRDEINNVEILNHERYKITNKDDNINNSEQTILTTNLNQQDFINNVLLSKEQVNSINNNQDLINQINNNIKFVYRNQILGKGLIEIQLKGDLGDEFLETKPKELISPLNNNKYIQHTKNENQSLFFWVDGFKKNYDFNLRKNKVLDASKLYIEPYDLKDEPEYFNTLSKYSASDIKNMVDSNDKDHILLKSLFNFSDSYTYENSNKYVKNKLLRTKLRYDEFIHLVDYKLLDDKNNININQINDFSGSYNGLIWFDIEAIKHNYITGGSDFNKLFFQNEAEFRINNLKRNVYIFPRPLNNDEKYVNYPEGQELTVDEFLSNSTINNLTDKFKVNFANMFACYNNKIWNETPNISEFNNKAFVTNASNQEQIIDAIDDKTIQFLEFIPNNPMGRITIKFKVVVKNGKINNKSSDNNGIVSEIFELNISGFKKMITIDNTTICNDINIINHEFGLNIHDPSEINSENFILNNLIAYSNTQKNKNINYIIDTNVTKDEFINELLENIVISTNNDDSEINGTIYFKEFDYNQKSINIPTVGRSVNFKIIGFNHKTKFNWNINKNIKISDFINDVDINKIDENYIIDNLILYDQNFNNVVANDEYLLATNVSKNYFVNNLLDKITIKKVLSENKISINIKAKNDVKNNIYLNNAVLNNDFNLIGFKNITQDFVLNNNLLFDNSNSNEINIRTINETMILDYMCSYGDENKNYNTLIDTNITKQDFIQNYLDKIVIESKDFSNSKLSGKFIFKKIINGNIEFEFNIEFLNKLNTILDINNNFNLHQSNILASEFDTSFENILKYISFNNQYNVNTIFTTNCSKQSFIDSLEEKPIDVFVDNELGIIEIIFSFKNNLMNIEMNDELILTNSLSVTIGGFKNNINFNLNNLSFNIDEYNVFDDIDVNDINQEFIINNLIMFSDDDNQKNIIGNININKKKFNRIISEINIEKNNNKLMLNFIFKTDINIVKNKNIVNNSFTCELYKYVFIENNKNNNSLLILSIIIPLLIIILVIIGIIVYVVWKRKKFKKAKINNI